MVTYAILLLGLQQLFNMFGYLLEFWYSDGEINIINKYSFTFVLCNVCVKLLCLLILH